MQRTTSGKRRRGGGKGSKDIDEINAIEEILKTVKPPSGKDTGHHAGSKDDHAAWYQQRKFEKVDVLSERTKRALKKHKFINMTAIQRAALPHALVGRDVLGAAKTGSGKTLAFLIPTIERLYRLQWNVYDGLGAIIISPTRELAMQIFEELRTIGEEHDLSAGLLIGGKDVAQEASRVGAMNILVATPGRLLQHMDESPDFNADNVKILVLDEADRILDMGFSATVNAIIANIPKHERQTLLFSATQTKSVSSLARLSLNLPEYVSAHADAAAPTPVKLDQAYMICNLQDKMDVVWSFIKTHLSSRIIIFFSTCNQVKFVYEAFRRLRPGTPLRCLHGKMSQQKRVVVYDQFCESKAGVLFATDIAARGLDFPKVDWVLQADCPEDVASYIHRVGRTARYTYAGKGLLLLLPSECDGMMQDLKDGKVELKCLKYNKEKIQPVSPALQALLSKDADVKTIAQKSVVSYLRSVFLQPKKHIFDVQALPAVEFALSVGLTSVPKMKILRQGQHQHADIGRGTGDNDDEEENMSEEPEGKGLSVKKNKKASVGDDDDDDFLVLKARHTSGEADLETVDDTKIENTIDTIELDSKKKKKKMKIRVNKATGTKVIFDDDGEALDPLEALAGDLTSRGDEPGYKTIEERVYAARMKLEKSDTLDKDELKQLRKLKRREKRARRLEREQLDSAPILRANGEGEDEYQSDSDEDSQWKNDEIKTGEDPAYLGMRAKRSDATLEEQEAAALALIRRQMG